MPQVNTPADWSWYEGRDEPMRYGWSDETYIRAVRFLADGCRTIQDWGAGMGYARRFVPADVTYTAVDWAPHAGADIGADLAAWRPDPAPDGIMLRHVLEHIPDWHRVLDNAAACARRRLAVVLFTPLGETTRRLVDTWQVDWSFRLEDITARLPGFDVRDEHVDTACQYDSGEHLIYAIKR